MCPDAMTTLLYAKRLLLLLLFAKRLKPGLLHENQCDDTIPAATVVFGLGVWVKLGGQKVWGALALSNDDASRSATATSGAPARARMGTRTNKS